MAYYRDWEEAATQSRFKKAIGPVEIKDRNGGIIKADIIIGRSVEPTLYYRDSGIVMDRRHIPARYVDRVPRWKPYA